MDSITLSADGTHEWGLDLDGVVYKSHDNIKKHSRLQKDTESSNIRLKSICTCESGWKVYGINRSTSDCVEKSKGGWIQHGVEKGKGFERVSISPNGKLLWFTDWEGRVYRDDKGKAVLIDDNDLQIRHITVDNGANALGTDREGKLWRWTGTQGLNQKLWVEEKTPFYVKHFSYGSVAAWSLRAKTNYRYDTTY
jgi:hypothetical protein